MAQPDLPPLPAPARTPRLVLIAEDEPEIAEILTAYLARGGLRTAHAADGRRALELHLQLSPTSCCSTCRCRTSTAGRCSPKSVIAATRP